jgi:hypothetical protein
MRFSIPMPGLRIACNAAFAVGLVACASAEPGRMTAETSSPQPLDAAADNAELMQDLAPSLVLTIEVDGDTATLLDARVLMMRATAPRHSEGEQVVLRGLSAGQPVSTVAVPDQKLNVQEGGGLVMQERRTLTAAIPMPQRLDAVEVLIPGAAAASRLDVREQVSSFCRQYATSEGCERGPD